MKTSKNKRSDNNMIVSNLHKINVNDLILLLNPNSQGGNTGKNWANTYNKVKDFLPKAHKIIFTKKANDGTSITRKLLRKGYKNIVAVGGDGTINEIANGFYDIEAEGKQTRDYRKFKPLPRLKPINPRATIYVIPSGIRNVLAKSLDLQHQGTESLMRIRQMKKSKAVDKIEELHQRHKRGEIITLLCYCRQAEHCHRYMIKSLIEDSSIKPTKVIN